MKAGRAMARIALLCASLALLSSCERPAPPDPRVTAFASLPKWDGYWSLATMRPEIYGFDAKLLSGGNVAGPKMLEFLGKTYPLAGVGAQIGRAHV